MPDAIKLDPKKTAFIIIDMVNAIAKGGPGPDYTLPDNRKDIVASFQKMIAHCRKVGTPLIYITTHRRADNADFRLRHRRGPRKSHVARHSCR